MAESKVDIQIATLAALDELVSDEGNLAHSAEMKPGLAAASSIIAVFIAALKIQQAPRRGRPRNQKAEA